MSGRTLRGCTAQHKDLHPAVSAFAGLGQVVDALLAYSGRHFARVDRLLRASQLSHYTLAVQGVLNAADGQE